MSTLTDRLSDIRTGGSLHAAQMLNIQAAPWDKFLFGGGTAKSAAGDFVLGDSAAVNALFNRDEMGSTYMAAAASTEEGTGKNAVRAKLQADMLASMQQAIGLRYSSRMRHMCASASRLRSIGQMDAEIIKLRTENV